MIKRLCIYFFYDIDGIVDRYVLHMLSAMRPHCTELAFVSNGDLSESGRRQVQALVDKVVERENAGFDVWAYKTMLETQYGWKTLDAFDEVIMMNSTIMGPVYPLEEVFAKTEPEDVDFWGLTMYHQLPNDPIGKCKYGYIPLHLQSHFIAVRKRLLESEAFRSYWREMPPIRSYQDAICFHEAIFTRSFADKGFRWMCYADTSDWAGHNVYPLLYTPVRVIKEKRCPIFKRRSFFHDYDDLCGRSLGEQGRELMEYLRWETSYDTDQIWENILRTCNLAEIHRCLSLYHILPQKRAKVSVSQKKEQKTALVCHLYYEDDFGRCREYALSMPPQSDVYLTTTSEEKRRKLQAVFSGGYWNHVEVRVVENRGRDVAALLVGCRDVAARYDLICFIHDKKAHDDEEEIVGESFFVHCAENVLSSREYVENIAALFQEHPRLGLLFSPPPCHGRYNVTLGHEWTNNFHNTQSLAEALGVRVPMRETFEPIAPLGTMFWFRPKALSILFEMDWGYDRFPPEPNGVDGTLLHAVERLYPFAAQQMGYYSAWCATQAYAERYTVTLCHMLRQERLSIEQGDASALVRKGVKRMVKSRIPAWVWELLRKGYRKIGGKRWSG